MADGEHRMLFDTRGRRKHVIRVVYAVLALLMGASLFLVVGPFNLGELAGNSGGGAASEVFEDQAERIEGRLAKSPEDEALLLTLTRARINSGNAHLEPAGEGEAPTITPEAQREFDAASKAWSRYLKQAGDEPSATAAQLVAGTFFRLAESSSSLLAAQEGISEATKAQRIAAERSPNLGSLSTLAIYEYFNGEFDAGDRAMKQATAKASSKEEVKSIEKQLVEYRKQAEKFDQRRKQLARVQQKVRKEQLKNPLGGLGGGGFGE
jgi:hypothetical protein